MIRIFDLDLVAAGLARRVKKDGKWTYERITDDKSEKEVLELFGSFKKQIRAGYFQLPNALPPVSEGGAK